MHGPAQAGILLCETFFLIIYRWHWWVIFCNFECNFRDVAQEAITPLLLGIDIIFCSYRLTPINWKM